MGLQTQIWTGAQRGTLNVSEKLKATLAPACKSNLAKSSATSFPPPPTLHTLPLALQLTTHAPSLISKPIFMAELKWKGGQAHKSMKVTQ